MKVKTENQIIKLLDKNFNLNVVPRKEFDGGRGLWVKDNICKPETDYYNYLSATLQDNRLNTFLSDCGWYAEAYDAETIMLYRI